MLVSEDKVSILVVDDIAENLKLLVNILKAQGYEARPVPSGKLAVQAATMDPPDLILLDINMPDMNGYEVCEQLKSQAVTSDIPVIFISALSEAMDKVKAFGVGGVDYITKPFQYEEVKARVETHVMLRKMQRDIKARNEHLQQIVADQVEQILVAHEQISSAQLQTITAMCKIAEARDDDTGRHIDRTQNYCLMLAQQLQKYPSYQDIIDDQFCDNILHASPLHDIGKVAISDAILKKPGPLTDEELQEMKTHSIIGARNLEAVRGMYPDNSFINMGISIAHYHHEKWDGSGYPEGLSGLEIPLEAQIMAVADVYDALRSERCYKPAFSHAKSRDIIMNDVGTHFAPLVGEAFSELEAEFDSVNTALQDA